MKYTKTSTEKIIEYISGLPATDARQIANSLGMKMRNVTGVLRRLVVTGRLARAQTLGSRWVYSLPARPSASAVE